MTMHINTKTSHRERNDDFFRIGRGGAPLLFSDDNIVN